MKNAKFIRTQLMLMVTVPLLCLAVVYISISMITSNKQVNDNNIVVSESTEQTIHAIINEWKASMLSHAEIIADQPTDEMVNAIKSKNTEAVIAMAKNAFTFMGVDGMTFTDAEGNVIARVPAPEKFGDNIKSSLAIADALNGRSVSYVYPTTNNGFSITTGVPIKESSGAQIGVLFISKRLDNAHTVDELKQISGCDIVIYQHDKAVMATLDAGSRAPDETLDPELWAGIQANKSVARPLRDGGANLVERYIPIPGRDGEVVGAILAVKTANRNTWVLIMWAIVFAGSLLVLYPVVRVCSSRFANPIRAIAAAAEVLSSGDTSVEIICDRRDEIGTLQKSMHALIEAMLAQSHIIESISDGDLTGSYTPQSGADKVGNSLVRMLESNNAMLAEIREVAEQVYNDASQITDGAQFLANGSSEQATAVEQLSATIQEVQVHAEETAASANQSNNEVVEADRQMQISMELMGKMTGAMKKMESNSKDVASVIKVIDDIAFQTNILALNAAVEAARAGQHGKGFAVVADEVRNLASKSATAAKETAGLIQHSVENVSSSVGIVKDVEQSLGRVGEIARSNAESIAKIHTAANHQKQALAEINESITQITQVLQGNSSTAEKNASAAHELSNQSAQLNAIVGRYKITGGASNGINRFDADSYTGFSL